MTPTDPFAPIAADSLVHSVVERYPQTVAVFVRHRLQCAGCCISAFHTIEDSAREYAVVLEPLLRDLNQAVDPDPGQASAGEN